MASKSLLDYFDANIGKMRVGMRIRLNNLPTDSLHAFRIIMGNDFTQSERIGADVVTVDLKGIVLFENEFYSLLEDAGYYIDYPEQTSRFFKYSPYMYLNKGDENNPHARMKVYLSSNEISGHAPEEEIQKIMEILNQCHYIHNIRLVYSWKVYDLSDDEYLSILDQAKPRIETWVQKYLEYGYSRSDIGDNFSILFGVKRISNKLSSDWIAINYVNNIAKRVNISNAKYVFRCEQCGGLVRKQRKCSFIYDYNKIKCPFCGGQYERIK